MLKMATLKLLNSLKIRAMKKYIFLLSIFCANSFVEGKLKRRKKGN